MGISLNVFLPWGRTIRFLNFDNEYRSWGLVSRCAEGQSLVSPHNSGRLGTGNTGLGGWEVVATFFPHEEVRDDMGVT